MVACEWVGPVCGMWWSGVGGPASKMGRACELLAGVPVGSGALGIWRVQGGLGWRGCKVGWVWSECVGVG